MVRRGANGGQAADLPAVADRHGYDLVYTVTLDVRPLVAAMVIAQHLGDHAASAVAVPTFEHAEPYRVLITEFADLLTPVQRYPRGHSWPERR
ncbi:hypothetical protein IU432_22855 [Nocardia cyriacigeorgica]|nr:hypothetical protein [Nocardia cyriacigeorgica]MBF6456266.1 hypothetical protein [Nocardia cyriacigeorgica]MBF6480838.1 hypothetical protein [Nocardia cyriacigeorgica]MBF6551072.1 hypothetical protein [Nocardia cyriacigeorgica]